MTVEHLFDVVTGIDGRDQTIVSEAQPLYRARHQIVMLLNREAQTVGDKHRPLALHFTTLAADFRDAGGQVLDGYVRGWQAVDGTERFIGLVPTGTDYRDAGRRAAPVVPTKILPDIRAEIDAHNTRRPLPPLAPRKPAETTAQRIARKMAKAAHDTTRKEP